MTIPRRGTRTYWRTVVGQKRNRFSVIACRSKYYLAICCADFVRRAFQFPEEVDKNLHVFFWPQNGHYHGKYWRCKVATNIEFHIVTNIFTGRESCPLLISRTCDGVRTCGGWMTMWGETMRCVWPLGNWPQCGLELAASRPRNVILSFVRRRLQMLHFQRVPANADVSFHVNTRGEIKCHILSRMLLFLVGLKNYLQNDWFLNAHSRPFQAYLTYWEKSVEFDWKARRRECRKNFQRKSKFFPQSKLALLLFFTLLLHITKYMDSISLSLSWGFEFHL